MIGAIIGDIVGSAYEWNNIKTEEFPLFNLGCFFTDDTVMTLAIAEGMFNGGTADAFIKSMKKYGHMYPDAGYGGRFGNWLFSEDIHPHNSWGNGSAMRVSSVAWLLDTLSTIEQYAEVSATRVYRLYKKAGLSLRKRSKKCPSEKRGMPETATQKPNSRWSLDFVFDTTATGQRIKYYLTTRPEIGLPTGVRSVAHILHRTFDKEKAKLLDFKRYHNIMQESDFDTRLFSRLEHQGVTIDNPNIKLIGDTTNDLLNQLY
ncbi:ADP-ribosylglycohydrolase family protein [Phosphitispora sp. TUW77]|uniref:ADP-ribosylglycohydrolase family protein n=1 Tax=Phosphitispora sp. TUW77 TaxID=3152361 RepID=UPI003AB689D4